MDQEDDLIGPRESEMVEAEEKEDPELALQEALSSLASIRTKIEVEACLKELLIRQSAERQEEIEPRNDDEEEVALFRLSKAVESPFELHAVVVQAIVFMADEEDDIDHQDSTASVTAYYRLCCIALMSQALRRCPDPLRNRSKRWTSILCETIRHVQVLLEDFEEGAEMSLLQVIAEVWLNHLLPVSCTVLGRIKLSNSSLETPLVSAFVGVTTNLLASMSLVSGGIGDLTGLATLTRTIEGGSVDTLERLLYSYPVWKETEDTDDDSLKRWATTTDSLEDERLCRIYTSWNEFGVTLLLMQASSSMESTQLDESGGTEAAIWICHAQTLLENSMWPEGLTLLQSRVLTQGSDRFPSNTSPTVVSTMQLLCNYLWSAAVTRQEPWIATSTYVLMQRLIQKCSPLQQVQVVGQLVEKCPYPGLVPKLFDLLRGLLVSAEQPPTSLWDALDERLRILAAQVEFILPRISGAETNEHLEDLMLNLESHVAIVTMLQVYIMQHKQRPPCRNLASISRTASVLSSLPRDSVDTGYRLDLLQDALTRLLQCLDAL